MKNPAQPTPLEDRELVFPGRIEHLLPPWDSLPTEYLDRSAIMSRRGPASCNVAATLFYRGSRKDTVWTPRKGIDTSTAIRHVGAVLMCWEPKHEHKIAGVGYLLALWFRQVRNLEEPNTTTKFPQPGPLNIPPPWSTDQPAGLAAS